MKKLIMDCDTGGDDAAAISLAIASNEIELLGVTTCMGNLPLWQTYRNSRELIHHYGLQNLQPALRQMAEVRLEYPEASLKELGEFLEPKVGKSGVNHRLRKLSELAEKMRM